MGRFFEWLLGRRQGNGARVDERELERALDLVIEHTDPRLKFLPGHERRLRAPLEKALHYLESVVRLLPGPLEMGRRAYGDDGRVNALFGSVEQMLDLFGRSEAVRDYLRQRPSLEHFCCSLGMVREEKRMLGMALRAEQVQREVQQTAVNFTGHWIGVVGGNEEEVREALRWRGLESLCISALERITALRQGDLRLLQERLDQVLEGGCGLDRCRFAGDREAMRRRLEENARRLRRQKVPGGTLEDYLEALAQVLAEPEQHLSVRCHSVRVDRLGVRVDQGDGGTEVTTARVARPGHPPFEVILALFPVEELRDGDYYRKRARAYVSTLEH